MMSPVVKRSLREAKLTVGTDPEPSQVECGPPSDVSLPAAMNRNSIEFPPHHVPLRADIHALGELMGEVLREQGGQELYELVEQDRLTAIRWREGVCRCRRGARGARARTPAGAWRASWCGRSPPGSSW